jgi:hypothetical protein
LRLERCGIVIPFKEGAHLAILLHRKVSSVDQEFFGSCSVSTSEEVRPMRERGGSKSKRLLIVSSHALTLRAGIILRGTPVCTGATKQVVAAPYKSFDA